MPRGTAWAGCCVQVVPKGSNINIPMFVMFKNEKCAALTCDSAFATGIAKPSESHCALSAVTVTTPPHYAKLTLVDLSRYAALKE